MHFEILLIEGSDDFSGPKGPSKAKSVFEINLEEK